MHMKNPTLEMSPRIMDWRNKEIDHSSAHSFPGDKKGLAKSKSYSSLPELKNRVIHSEEIKESKCFTSAFENLKLDAGIDDEIDRSPSPKTKDAKNSSFEDSFKEKSPLCGFRTHDKCSYRLVIQGPEIFNYQSTLHSPEDVAPYWKKDSRMWLWKSVRFARRKNKIKCLMNQTSSNNRHDGFKRRGSLLERIN